MTAPAAIRQADITRAARVAKAERVAVSVKSGDLEITVFPDARPQAGRPIDDDKDIRL